MHTSRKLNIAHLAPFYYPVIGGMERVVQNIAEGICAKGHSIDVFTTDVGHDGKEIQRPRRECINGVNVYRFRSLLRYGFVHFFPGFVAQLATKKYDIIHLHSYRHLHTDIGWIIGKMRSIPVILHGHSPFFPLGTIPRYKSVMYAWYDALARFGVLKNVSVIFALTQLEKDEYIKRGALKEKVVIVPNGVSDEFFTPTMVRLSPTRVMQDKKILLYVGRLHPIKRIDLIIKALPTVIEKEPLVTLVLAGPGEHAYCAQLLALAKTLNVDNHIQWHGSVSNHKDILNLYTSAACVILPSDYEPFGLVLLEAMAVGKPVVAAQSGGPAEIIDDGTTGMLFERGSSKSLAATLLRLLSDQTLSEEMGKNAHKKAEKFRVAIINDAIEKTYRELTHI